MTRLYSSRDIFLAKSKISKAGRGVFAVTPFKKAQTIEICPVIRISGKDVPLIKQTELKSYYFIWHKPKKVATKVAICLGFGSIYNHSYQPNATYKKLLTKDLIKFVALKNIRKGEEITVNYNYGNPNDKTTLWIKKIKPAVSVRK